MSFARVTALLALVASLTACNPAATPTDVTAAPGAANSAKAAAAPQALTEFGSTLLWADPLATCEAHQVTMIHWSKDAVAKGPASIELGDTNPGVFARIGDAGEKLSGPWAAPGSVIVLRGSDGVARARLVLKGPDSCTAH